MKVSLASFLAVLAIPFAFSATSQGTFPQSGPHAGLQPLAIHPNPGPLGALLCPFQTAEEWQEFLEHYAGDEKWVETCEDSTCDANYYQFVQENIQSVFDRCAGFFERHETVARCVKNMRRFTPFWLKQHDSVSYGFLRDNPSYLAAETTQDKPQDMMKVPEGIVNALPYRKDVEEAARQSGFQYLTHDSAIDGFRTFIFIPDPAGRFDKFMLLNLKTGNSSVKEKTQLSVLGVLKEDERGNLLSKVRLYFRDYTIMKTSHGDPGQGNTAGYQLALNQDGNGKCFSCHSNGVRQLIPFHTPILNAKPVQGDLIADSPDFAYQRLMQFNRKLRSYGTPDWDGNIVPENLGPALGAKQGCMDCHNGSTRAPLTVFTSTHQIEQKMYHELSMPPDTRLPALVDWIALNQSVSTSAASPNDMTAAKGALQEARGMHAALTKDYEDSRLPALRDWFLETTCR